MALTAKDKLALKPEAEIERLTTAIRLAKTALENGLRGDALKILRASLGPTVSAPTGGAGGRAA